MTNAGWQMTNAGWRMGDDKRRDETGHPRFPGAGKWAATSAFRAPTSKSRMRSKIMKKIKTAITMKIRTQFAALPCALHPLPYPDRNPDPDRYPDRYPDPDRNPPRPPLILCTRFMAMSRRGGEKQRRNGLPTFPGCQKVGGLFRPRSLPHPAPEQAPARPPRPDSTGRVAVNRGLAARPRPESGKRTAQRQPPDHRASDRRVPPGRGQERAPSRRVHSTGPEGPSDRGR